MKKTYFSSRHIFVFMLLLVVLIYGCRKELTQKTVNAEQNPSKTLSVANAKSYLDSALKINSVNIKLASSDSSSGTQTFTGYLFWDKAQSFLTKNFEVVEIPAALDYRKVNFYKLGGDTSNYITDKTVAEAAFTRVLIFRDSTRKVMDKRIITYIPDKSYLAKNVNPSAKNWINSIDKDYSGYIEYRTWKNMPYLVLRLINGKVKANYNLTPQNNSTNLVTQGLKTNSFVCDEITVDVIRTGWYGGSIVYQGVIGTESFVSCSEVPDGYSPEPTFDGGGTSSGGGGGGTTSPTISDADIANATYVDDGKPPIDPTKYINCFTDGKTANEYKLTLYIDQPIHGQNDWWSLDGYGEKFISANGIKFDVGHAFVGFQKINTDNTSVTQVMGFYPNPRSISADGVIKNDGGHPFDVSYTVTVSAAQFQAALSNVIYDNGFSMYTLSAYQLNTHSEYNCTDAAIQWMRNASVTMPASTNRGIFVNSPGDYGQALKNLNGANTTAGNAPISHGACN